MQWTMARLTRLQSFSVYLLDSRGVSRLIAPPAASFSVKSPQSSAVFSSPSSLFGHCSLPFSSRRRSGSFCGRSSSLTDFVGISCCSHSHGVYRSFFSGSRGDESPEASTVPSPPPTADSPPESIPVPPKDFMDAANNTMITLKETATSSIVWIQNSFDSLIPVLRERFDLPVYTPETVSQLLYTSVAAILAWLVMPRVFRMLHRYFEDGSYLILRRFEKVPYEASFWFALENPAKLFISVVAFSELSSLIAPTTVASQHLHQIWKGAAVVSVVWFLHRWKGNVLSRMLANENLGSVDRERLHTLEKVTTIGLFILGAMGVAETCGIAAQSILTVGGIGGVATAFAARDLLGNMLSGLALQFMKPFSLGDTIKAGPVEGQVLDIGLTSTQLLDLDKFPVNVPNSFFSSQAIVNKSRATWRAFTLKVPVQLTDFEKIPQITQELRNLLKSHPKVTLQNGVPLCHASRIAGASLEIAIACNLTFKGREDLLSAEQDITVQALRIITNAGATLTAAA